MNSNPTNIEPGYTYMVVTDIPNPYRVPLFNLLHQKLQKRGHRLKVIFGSASQTNRKFKLDLQECKFDYEILPSKRVDMGFEENTVINYNGLLGAVNNEQPEAIVVIGFTVATMKLWWNYLFSKSRYIIWSGSIKQQNRSIGWIRKLQRKILVSGAQGYLAYGNLAKQYFESLGALPKKIHIAINTTETDFFYQQVTRLRKAPVMTAPIKQLAVLSYLSPRKNIIRVLEIIRALADDRQDFNLTIVGEGPEEELLKTYVKKNALEAYVSFVGFKQKEDLPAILGQTDIFLFQTNFDIWGLTLVEAMASGLPCVASINAGATADLIKEGETGFAVDFDQIHMVVGQINWLMDHQEEAIKIGCNASDYIQKHVTLEHSVKGFLKAFNLK